jgi:hypothetical protein
MDSLVNAALYLLLNAVYLLVTVPILKAYGEANAQDTGKALSGLGIWMVVTLAVGLTTAQLFLA